MVSIVGALVSLHALAAETCPPIDTLRTGPTARFELLPGDPVRPGDASFRLGFNLEWKTFQRDIWKDAVQNVEPVAGAVLSQWPGMIYRFPGGTVSNFLDLNLATGDRLHRPKQKAVSWDEPEGMTFGLMEYAKFVTEVQGAPWVVANIFGRIEGADSIEVLRPKWEALAARLKEMGGVGTIELGNELYLDRYGMTPEQYVERANAAAEVFGKQLPQAKFVVALSDFDVRSHRKADYNSRVLSKLKIDSVAFAQHSYYDGPPGGPPIPNRLRAICDSIAQIKGSGRRQPVVWLTEHARWPGGKTSDPDWKKLWGKSNNLEAAISVADFTLATSQIPEVHGAFLHSLAGTSGPWSFFMRDNSAVLRSALAEAQSLLMHLGDAEVMATRTVSPKGGGWGSDYDTRGVILRSGRDGTWQLLAINRSGKPLDGSVVIPALTNVAVTAIMRSVSGSMSDTNNSADEPHKLASAEASNRIDFDAKGAGLIQLKPYSITFFEFRPQRAGGSDVQR